MFRDICSSLSGSRFLVVEVFYNLQEILDMTPSFADS